MTRSFPVSILLGLIFFLATANSAAYYWHLYFYYPWLDVPMHFVGGLWITLYLLSWYYTASRTKKKERAPLFVLTYALAVTLVIGVLWEVFEFSVDTIIEFSQHNPGDTLLDLVMDAIGALFGAYVFLRGGYNKGEFLNPNH